MDVDLTLAKARRNSLKEDDNKDVFLVCIFKMGEANQEEAAKFLEDFVATMRLRGGKVQLRSRRPQLWNVVEGLDHHVEPNHLNPATFDFNAIVIAGFTSTMDVHAWWNSNEVFELLKWRSSMEKIGIFTFDGIGPACDFTDRQRMTFGNKTLFVELLQMQSFKPMQQYVDDYKRFAGVGSTDVAKAKVHLLFAEGASGVLMNEYPLDLACASTWKNKLEAQGWYDSGTYQNSLLPLRAQYSRSLVMILPVCDEEYDRHEAKGSR